ncbi:hypothetical protein Aduo_017645 [Ancylostoma duodenale]
MSAFKYTRPSTTQDDLLEMVCVVRKSGGMTPKWAERVTSPLAGANHVPRSTRYCTATKAEMRCQRICMDDWIGDENAAHRPEEDLMLVAEEIAWNLSKKRSSTIMNPSRG